MAKIFLISETDMGRINAAVRKVEGMAVRGQTRHRRPMPPLAVDVGTSESVAVILPSTFETETAQSDTWDITDQGDNDGVQVRLQTRMVYDDTSDEILYAFFRTFKYDNIGRLISISAETRVTIEIPEECT